MKIYLTGDTHGKEVINKLLDFNSRHRELTKNDYVIVLGDFLGTGDDYKYIINLVESLNFSVAFIDGDSENYELLNALKVEEFKSGLAHILSKDVVHLLRGEVYLFDELKIFTFGGGDFLTNQYGLENGSIPFKERIPTLQQLKNGLKNLEKYNYKVDFILTHESPSSAFIYTDNIKVSYTTKMLDKIDDVATCKWWYFGHYHHDMLVKNNKTILYEKFIRIN